MPSLLHLHVNNNFPSLSLKVTSVNSLSSLYVYPNPASEIVFVESSSLKDKTIQMVNMNGETVKSVKANSNKIQIAISDLIAGEYILFTEDGTLNGIVIVK